MNIGDKDNHFQENIAFKRSSILVHKDNSTPPKEAASNGKIMLTH